MLFRQWNDGMPVKAVFLYKEAEEGHVQAQLPVMLNNVREQGWQGEVLPRNWRSLSDKTCQPEYWKRCNLGKPRRSVRRS